MMMMPMATQNTYLAVLAETIPDFSAADIELLELARQHDAVMPVGIYFPLTCVMALETRLPDGCTYMLRLVGADGIVNLMDRDPVQYPVTILKTGLAARLKNDGMERAIGENPERVEHMLALYRARNALYALNSGCLARHSLRQRLARLMLRAGLSYGLDREMTLTQVEIARLIAARRETVAELLNRLAVDQVIKLRRGAIRILKRDTLRETSCECFAEEMKLEHHVAVSIASMFRDFDYRDYVRSRSGD